MRNAGLMASAAFAAAVDLALQCEVSLSISIMGTETFGNWHARDAHPRKHSQHM